MSPRGGWWRRNKVALIALLPLAAAAASASSYQLTDVWLPSQPWRATDAGGPTGHYHSTFVRGGHTFTRDADVTVVGVRQEATFDGRRAAEGARLEVVTLRIAADPDVPLDSCQVALLDHGTPYGTVAGQAKPDGRVSAGQATCVPKDAPGPTVDAFTGKLTHPEDKPARPREWTTDIAIAVPNGVEPAQLRLYWDTPGYLLLTLPR